MLPQIAGDGARARQQIAQRRSTLSPEIARKWLDPKTLNERAEQMELFQGEPIEAFEWFKIDQAIGNVRNQDPDLVRPAQ